MFVQLMNRYYTAHFLLTIETSDHYEQNVSTPRFGETIFCEESTYEKLDTSCWIIWEAMKLPSCIYNLRTVNDRTYDPGGSHSNWEPCFSIKSLSEIRASTCQFVPVSSPTSFHIRLNDSPLCLYLALSRSARSEYSPASTLANCRPITRTPASGLRRDTKRLAILTCLSQLNKWKKDAAWIISIFPSSCLMGASGSKTSPAMNLVLSVSLSRKRSYPNSIKSIRRSEP